LRRDCGGRSLSFCSEWAGGGTSAFEGRGRRSRRRTVRRRFCSTEQLLAPGPPVRRARKMRTHVGRDEARDKPSPVRLETRFQIAHGLMPMFTKQFSTCPEFIFGGYIRGARALFPIEPLDISSSTLRFDAGGVGGRSALTPAAMDQTKYEEPAFRCESSEALRSQIRPSATSLHLLAARGSWGKRRSDRGHGGGLGKSNGDRQVLAKVFCHRFCVFMIRLQ